MFINFEIRFQLTHAKIKHEELNLEGAFYILIVQILSREKRYHQIEPLKQSNSYQVEVNRRSENRCFLNFLVILTNTDVTINIITAETMST